MPSSSQCSCYAPKPRHYHRLARAKPCPLHELGRLQGICMAFAKRLLSTRCSVLMPSYIRIANAWHLPSPSPDHRVASAWRTARRSAVPLPPLQPVARRAVAMPYAVRFAQHRLDLPFEARGGRVNRHTDCHGNRLALAK